MTQVKFVRTTHKNGRFRALSTEAAAFWREHGWIIGESLRAESPLTFAEIVTASREYALEFPASSPLLPLDEAYIAWCLVKLLVYGVAGQVPDKT